MSHLLAAWLSPRRWQVAAPGAMHTPLTDRRTSLHRESNWYCLQMHERDAVADFTHFTT